MTNASRPAFAAKGLSLAFAALFAFQPAVPLEAAAAYQTQLLRLHNRERAKRNRPRLRLHGALNRAAVKYARVMNTTGHFDHDGLDGSTATTRIFAECSDCFNTWGENIALGQRTPAEVTRGWIRSPGHRRNILNRRFTRVGFGRAGSPTYWVTNFGG